MSGLRCGTIVALLLALGACALPGSSGYEDWQGFYTQLGTMEPGESRMQYQAALERHQQSPSAASRLQLAYLILFFPESQAEPAENVAVLLQDIEGDQELAPIRDLLLRYSQLAKTHASQTAKLKELGQQCQAVKSKHESLQRESKGLEQKLAVCADQLEALKQIESVMSAPQPALRLLP